MPNYRFIKISRILTSYGVNVVKTFHNFNLRFTSTFYSYQWPYFVNTILDLVVSKPWKNGLNGTPLKSFKVRGNLKAWPTILGVVAINREVERLLKIEKKVVAIPQILPVGPICLQTNPIKDALHGFSMAWKNQYASVLHDEAKVSIGM